MKPSMLMLRTVVSAAAAGALLLAPACFLPGPSAFTPDFDSRSFVNWESPHVTPLALSADSGRLYAVNTAAARVEIFDVSGDRPAWIDAIPVGLDPVSARLRHDGELWVVNHVSDSVSIIDLDAGLVVGTLRTDDEPTDVVFTGGKAFVVCSQVNRVLVYDLDALHAPPRILEIMGKDPRAAAVSSDGRYVYVSVFESGNHSTLIPWEVVSDPRGPYGGVNPPPDKTGGFAPSLDASLPPPPPVSLIVRKQRQTGAWLDDNGADWSEFVTWDLHDHDLAVIDAETLVVRYVPDLMTMNMHLAAAPDGRVLVVGTEASNEVRFEPRLTGRFVRSVIAQVDPRKGVRLARHDLNPHLADAYARELSRVEPALRDLSLADPRGVAVLTDGRVLVTGMGSDNLAVFDSAGHRTAQSDLGAGPTGVVVDEPAGRAFVLNRFDASISQVSLDELAETSRIAFFDPTPAVIKAGRPFLYNARLTSGLGVTSCAACHVDARTDQLAWDLGDPAGEMKRFNQECNFPFFGLPVGECEDWHPMKGPMTTQTFQSIIGTEPFHWRGDRENLAAFNPAFVGLLGRQSELATEEMAAFEAFLATIRFPPNPNRNLDHSLKEWVGDGRPNAGEQIFFNGSIDLGIVQCNDCHALPDGGRGTNRRITPRELLIIPHQSIVVPQIRNMHEKTGFSKQSLDNSLGFGHNHDGNVDGLVNFFHIPNFTGFAPGEVGERQRRDLIAFVMSIGSDTHAGIGAQVTLGGRGTILARDVDAAPATPDELVESFMRLADDGFAGLVVHGRIGDRRAGLTYLGAGRFQGDRPAEIFTAEQLRRMARPAAPQTWTLVPPGMALRLGADPDGIVSRDSRQR